MRGALASLVLAACGGTGTVSITAWGSVGDGAPASLGYPGGGRAFVDGWSLRVDHWITSLSAIELGGVVDHTVYLADWTRAAAPVAIGTVALAEGEYAVSFASVPAIAAATRLTAVDDALADAMVAGGWTTYLAGTATRDGATVTFAWGLRAPVRYRDCTLDGRDGIAVAADATVEARLGVHLDHAFWDRLDDEHAPLRFDAIAGWRDATGAVPLDDLTNASTAFLTDRGGVPISDHGQPLAYDDAGLGLGNLRDFILFATGTQGHLNGEGPCTHAVP